jgi:hypothetical protein
VHLGVKGILYWYLWVDVHKRLHDGFIKYSAVEVYVAATVGIANASIELSQAEFQQPHQRVYRVDIFVDFMTRILQCLDDRKTRPPKDCGRAH